MGGDIFEVRCSWKFTLTCVVNDSRQIWLTHKVNLKPKGGYRRPMKVKTIPMFVIKKKKKITERWNQLILDFCIFFPCMKSRVEYDRNGSKKSWTNRSLSKQTVVRKKLKSVGLVAILLAWKYKEVLVPVVGDLILISDEAYTWKEVLEMVLFFGYDYAHYIRFKSYNKQLMWCPKFW